MRMRVLLPAAGLVALAGLAAPAQNPKDKAALPADVVPATFRAFLVTDGRFPPVKTADGKDEPDPRNRTGKIHCLVCEYGLAPVVAVFVRADAKTLGQDSGVAKLTKNLNDLIPKFRADKLAGFVAFLRLEGGEKAIKLTAADGTETTLTVDQEYPDDEKRDVYAEDIRKFANAVAAPNVPFGLAPEKSKAIAAWGVKDTDEVTVVVYYRMRMVGKPWGFAKAADLTDAKIDEILKAAEGAITKQK